MSAYSSMCKKIQSRQGILTILPSYFDGGRACGSTTSLRRTLSADMSSKKWLSQNALFSPMMKKVASSEELKHSKPTASHDSSFSSSEGEEEEEVSKKLGADEEAEQERFQIWSTIQRDKSEPEKQIDTWSSILFSQKAKDETLNFLPVTPYVHPLVKRSKSSMSEKSLEICTESLGSETGSDNVFSSSNSNSSPSETEDSEEEQGQENQEHEEQEFQVPEHIQHVKIKSSTPRCFPPPLPSLHMRSHRDGNGRLFLEAVTVASQKNKFCAQRQAGRLVLTFAAGEEEDEEEEEDEVAELQEEFVGFDEDDEVKEYEEDENYEEGEVEEEDDDDDDDDDDDEILEDVEAVRNNSNKLNIVSYGDVNQKQFLVLKGKNDDFLVHSSKSCKDSRRSFLFWEPHCIAT